MTTQNTSTGVFLKQARESQGHSLEVVHEATKIPLDILRAIEEGYSVRTLSPFYYKGFVKLYAQYLNVDLKDVITDYKKEELPKYVEEKFKGDEFDLNGWIERNLTPDRKRLLLKGVAVTLGVMIIFKVFTLIAHHKGTSKTFKKEIPVVKVEKNAKPKARKEEPIEKITEKNLEKKEISKVVSVITPQVVEAPLETKTVTPMESQTAVKKNVTLTVRARKDSWLSTKADGEVVFESTLRAGSVETWTADKQIEISGKNIGQLEFELNGKMVGSLGRDDRRAKKLIVTKDGLQVTK